MFKSLTQLFRAPATLKPARRPRLSVETLEDRAVPADFTSTTVAALIADMNTANSTPGADTITLVSGTTYTLTAVDHTTNGPTGLPTVVEGEDLTIVGNGATIERSTAAGTPAFRLIETFRASLTLRDITLQGGYTTGSGLAACGGAVLSWGTLKMTGVTVQYNTAQGSPGASDGEDACGGGVYSVGPLEMTGCTVQYNSALAGRGAPGGTVGGWVWNGGPGGSAYGGGLYASDAMITDCLFSANTAKGGTGGASRPNTKTSGSGGNAYGGGVYTDGDPVTILGTTVTGNSALGGAAGDKWGSAGKGYGGGIAMAPWASLFLDSFTVRHIKGNKASGGSDIYGSYTVI